MIKNIVFDIGNVLITFQPKECLRAQVEDEGLREKLHQAIFLSPEWLLLDQGVISEKDAVHIFRDRCPEVKTIISSSMHDLYEKLLHPIEENIAVLYELKKIGYHIYLLSNYQEKAFEFISERYRFPAYVDGMILSYEVNLLKPAPEIYQALLRRYHLLPSETVFIDDSINNILTAESLGIRGIHYKGHDALRMDLKQVLTNS